MLKGKNIYKSFDNLEVLKDINIEIERGKIVSIVGKSGAGKSTLLYILSTLDKATNGEVLFDNKKLDELKGDDLSNFRNKKIGFIFQFHNLLSEFTVLENVSIPALISSSDKEKIKIKAKEILEKLGLFDRLTHKPNELSGGEQQRVAIARSLINSPDIVFADEPTGNLDSENGQKIIELMKRAATDFNTTIILVTHNPQIAEFGNRHFEIRDGKLTDI